MSTGRANGRLVFTGSGLICSVGWDAASACAAIRAGISRPVPLDAIELLDELSSEPRPIFGHPVAGYTDGFIVPGRWNRLCRGALLDLLGQAALPPRSEAEFWSGCGLVFVVPALNPDRFQTTAPIPLETVARTMGAYLRTELDLPIELSRVAVVSGGHAAGLAGLQAAQRLLDDGQAERVIVVSVDSLLDPLSLAWLADQERLKLPDTPVGLEPGEAGVALMVETQGSVRRRPGRPRAVLTSLVVEAAKVDLLSTESRSRHDHAMVIDRAIEHCAPFSGQVLTDLTGEEWRAYHLSAALGGLSRKLDPRLPLLTPLRSTGDTGAACTALAICLAIHCHERDQGQGERALILGTSEDGPVGAATLAFS